MKFNARQYSLASFSVLIALSGTAHSATTYMEARNDAMGGTGVASSHYGTAALANPALLTHFGASDDFSLILPSVGAQVARFRSLTEEQKAMLASARKGEKKNGIPCYTEGVVLARNWNALFRSVPPSLYLALGMTEKDEKAQRRELMKTHQCSELEAVFMVARNLDERRGVSV